MALLTQQENKLLLIIKKLSFCRSVQQVMDIVRRSAREATGADGVTFVLREGENVYYAEENAIGPLWKGRRFPATACISGWTMLNRKAAVIEDIYQDSRIPCEAYRPTFVKSLVMMPVRTEDPVAAIGAYWAEEHRATEEEISTLQTIADATSLALENAELYGDLQAALDRERRSNRAKDEWLSIISHELRTPLTPVFGWIRLLQTRKFEEDKVKSALEIVERNLHTHMRLVQDLIDVSRMLMGKLAVEKDAFDLRHCVQTVLEPFKISAESKSIRLVLDVPAASFVVFGDQSRLCQAIQNLLDNAIKFTAEGGTVAISLSASRTTANLTISDTGIGISPEFIPKIFERFSQEDSSSTRPAGGLGLGLWVVRHIVELHGGEIEVKSEKGKGSTFTIRVPLNGASQ
jgi:two-component system CheB/CheR fusion protein